MKNIKTNLFKQKYEDLFSTSVNYNIKKSLEFSYDKASKLKKKITYGFGL